MPVSEDGRPASPGVRFPPPLVFVLPFLAAYLLNTRVEFLIVGAGAGVIQTAAGMAMLGLGLLLMIWGLVTFVRRGTSPLPFRGARALVVEGPYRFTRNPMYLGMMTAYFGGVLATNWAWPLVFLPLVIAVMSGYVIAREERYLGAEFGADFESYCGRVRRWL